MKKNFSIRIKNLLFIISFLVIGEGISLTVQTTQADTYQAMKKEPQQFEFVEAIQTQSL